MYSLPSIRRLTEHWKDSLDLKAVMKLSLRQRLCFATGISIAEI